MNPFKFWQFTYYIFLNFFFLLKSECDPLVAVAERRVEVDKFSKLREHDVCDVIRVRFLAHCDPWLWSQYL